MNRMTKILPSRYDAARGPLAPLPHPIQGMQYSLPFPNAMVAEEKAVTGPPFWGVCVCVCAIGKLTNGQTLSYIQPRKRSKKPNQTIMGKSDKRKARRKQRSSSPRSTEVKPPPLF